MNRQHFMLALSIIAFSLLITLYIKGNTVKEEREEIQKIEETVDFAAYSAVCTLSDTYGEKYSLREVTKEFFQAYEVHSQREKEDLWMYVPAFVYLDYNYFMVGNFDTSTGEYNWHEDEAAAHKKYELSHDALTINFTLDNRVTFILGDERITVNKDEFFATDKSRLPAQTRADIADAERLMNLVGYTEFTENNYYALKDSAIATCVSLAVTDCINNHNRITRDKGVTFIYNTPYFLDIDYELPSFIVCFQGYPLECNGKYYSNLVNRAAYLRKEN